MKFITKKCNYCGKEYPVENNQRRIKESKFCSHGCYSKNLIGKPTRRYEKILRSGYWFVYSPGHPSNTKQKYVAEHRLVMEKIIGRTLTRKEVVHHINGDKLDNRECNLTLFESPGIHSKIAHPSALANATKSNTGRIPWNKAKKYERIP